jgi:hypothetical protein
MSKLAHSNDNTMIEIERLRLEREGTHQCKRCGEIVDDGSDQDGCRDPECPEQHT